MASFFEHAQINFLEPGLQRGGHVVMALLQRFFGLARGRFQQTGHASENILPSVGVWSESAQDISGPVLWCVK